METAEEGVPLSPMASSSPPVIHREMYSLYNSLFTNNVGAICLESAKQTFNTFVRTLSIYPSYKLPRLQGTCLAKLVEINRKYLFCRLIFCFHGYTKILTVRFHARYTSDKFTCKEQSLWCLHGGSRYMLTSCS